MDLKLSGHTALVTGAASGIGLATARLFAEKGCSLPLGEVNSRIGVVGPIRLRRRDRSG